MSKENFQFQAKVETYQKGDKWGYRVCFLYDDRAPEVFEKDGFESEDQAFDFGNFLVKETIASIPGGVILETGMIQ